MELRGLSQVAGVPANPCPSHPNPDLSGVSIRFRVHAGTGSSTVIRIQHVIVGRCPDRGKPVSELATGRHPMSWTEG
jgi:hypothetical protein